MVHTGLLILDENVYSQRNKTVDKPLINRNLYLYPHVGRDFGSCSI